MATTGRSESRLFVRNSTGLVRSASAVDATIFNAVISAPIGSTLAWSIFFTLVAFPGADPVGVLIIAAVINIPVLIMFALLGASMPRVGGDYVWVSRILNPPLALISNLCMIMGGLLGAAYFDVEPGVIGDRLMPSTASDGDVVLPHVWRLYG